MLCMRLCVAGSLQQAVAIGWPDLSDYYETFCLQFSFRMFFELYNLLSNA